MISTITGFWNNFWNLNRVGWKWSAAPGQIRDLSNFTDFSWQNGKRYRQTVFSIVICTFELVFARKFLNHISIRFSRNSIFAVTHVKIRDFVNFSNLADFSRRNAERYLKTVFFIVFYAFDLIFSRKILNHISFRFSRKSILAMSSMSKFVIFRSSPSFKS